MPLFRKPSTQDLEDHFFGSGAFSYGWFDYDFERNSYDDEQHFPVVVREIDVDEPSNTLGLEAKLITEEMFIEGIKKYAESLPDRSFDDLIEDMDANDVDNVIQLIMFGEIRYA